MLWRWRAAAALRWSLNPQNCRCCAARLRLAEKGYITGGCKRNKEYLSDKMVIDKSIREGLVEVALDPQTSGGLLIAVAKRHAAKLIEDLHAAGVTYATEVGYATSLQKPWVRLV